MPIFFRQPGANLLYILLIAYFGACNGDKNKHKLDVSHIEAPVSIDRFEQALFALPADSVAERLHGLYQRYPDFLPVYLNRILNLGDTLDLSDTLRLRHYSKELGRFLQNRYIQALYDTCMYHYSELGWLEEDLQQAFRYYRHHFSDTTLPRVYTFISEFGYGVITHDEKVMGIGLDMFLGQHYKYYRSLEIPNYVQRTLEPAYILPNCMKAWIQGCYPEHYEERNMINEMVYNGKVRYCLDALLPGTPDTLKIGYSQQQLAWCEKNESEIWAYFIDHDLLFETDIFKYKKYVNIGPTTPGMPPGSPGNVGSWVGWQIVRKFMAENPQITLETLMHDPRYTGEEILRESKYKPRKTLF